MIFKTRGAHKFDTKVLNSICDDLIEIKKNSRNKEDYRRYLISTRIEKIDQSKILTRKAIDRLIFELHYSEVSTYELCKTYKKVAKSIQTYHKELLNLFNQMRSDKDD